MCLTYRKNKPVDIQKYYSKKVPIKFKLIEGKAKILEGSQEMQQTNTDLLLPNPSHATVHHDVCAGAGLLCTSGMSLAPVDLSKWPLLFNHLNKIF